MNKHFVKINIEFCRRKRTVLIILFAIFHLRFRFVFAATTIYEKILLYTHTHAIAKKNQTYRLTAAVKFKIISVIAKTEGKTETNVASLTRRQIYSSNLHFSVTANTEGVRETNVSLISPPSRQFVICCSRQHRQICVLSKENRIDTEKSKKFTVLKRGW